MKVRFNCLIMNKQRIIESFMLLAVMIAIDSKAQATYIVDGIKYYTNFESQTAYVTCKFPIPAYKGDIIIASTVAGLPVVGIDEQAFADCDEVTSVLLPETIQYIGNIAFKGCKGLKSINFPSSLKTICTDAFKECSNLTSLEFPCTLSNIESSAFWDCKSLRKISFYTDLLMAENTFFGCDNLDSVTVYLGNKTTIDQSYYGLRTARHITLPEGLTSISSFVMSNMCFNSISLPFTLVDLGHGVFNTCENLDSIIIPDNVKTISKYMFGDCKKLVSVTIPDAIDSIGDYAFSRCVALSSIKLPDSLKYIGSYAFQNCKALNELHLPQKISSIEDYAFDGCSSLTSLTIPEGVTTISENAFALSTGLVSISLPKTLTVLESQAFSNEYKNEDKLKGIFCYAPIPPMPSKEFDVNMGIQTDPFLFRSYEATVYVPEGCKDIYENNRVWGRFAKIEELNTSGIQHKEKDEDSIVGIYTLRGERVQSSNHKGLFIIKMKDGSTKKMLKN